jgi:hypothetical protein
MRKLSPLLEPPETADMQGGGLVELQKPDSGIRL